ncbi:coproporphyrinogen III oxidase [Spirochaetia bacterium]|nr:coproporphyrinogen III oxidase [Spirochaetia bacterium]
MDSPELSLYLHIPFCTEKCDYCDFYSVPAAALSLREQDFLKNRFIDSLLAETERQFAELTPAAVPSIYIGGGTPSVLGASGMSRLLRGLAEICGPAPAAGPPREISVEANPETAEGTFLAACADHGVSRLSLGVQSFDTGLRRAVGRRGDTVLLPRRLREAAEIFGPGLSLDLMSGLPGQNREKLLEDIKKALSYKPGHISLYALSVEEGTPLAARFRYGQGAHDEQAAAEEADALWLTGRETLIRAGYEHYEVSNFALMGQNNSKRCVHNIRYWRMENWLGIGPAASGTIIGENGGIRLWYAPDVEAFLAGPTVLREDLDPLTVLKETILMGYRYIEGPDPVLVNRRFGKKIEEIIPRTLEKWQKRTVSLKEEIMLFLNAFLLDAFMELDELENSVKPYSIEEG